jgi:hypothetical protein
LAKDEHIDFSDPEMASIKNKIDILNENLHTLGHYRHRGYERHAEDAGSLPLLLPDRRTMAEPPGRSDGNKVIVVPEDFALLRRLELGDELQLTFRPLKDTFWVHSRWCRFLNWRSYPTYQDTFKSLGYMQGLRDSRSLCLYSNK